MSWPLVALGDVVTLRTGPFGSSLHESDYVADGVPLINPKHIRNGRLFPDTKVTVSGKKLIELRDFSLEAQDVVMGRRGEMGRCAVITEVEHGWLCGTGSIIIRPSSIINSDFLQRFLASPETVRTLERESVGTTMINLNQKILLSLKMPLPPLPEQLRIAATLDKADTLRAKRREAIAKLDQLLQSVFLEMFGDPVRNSKGWPSVQLGDVTESRLGKMLDKKTRQGNDMKPYLANLNVQWGRFELEQLREMNFNDKEQNEFSLRSGDLLMCEGGEPGRCAIWKGQIADCYYQKALHRIRCNSNRITPEYLQWLFWFLSHANAFRSSVSAATIAHLPGIKLKKLTIPLPPIDLQLRFRSVIERFETQSDNQSKSKERLDRAFASLQNITFSGRP